MQIQKQNIDKEFYWIVTCTQQKDGKLFLEYLKLVIFYFKIYFILFFSVHAQVCLWVCVHICAIRNYRTMLGFFLSSSGTYFFSLFLSSFLFCLFLRQDKPDSLSLAVTLCLDMLSSDLHKSPSYLPLPGAAPLPIIYLFTRIWTHPLTWDLHLIVSIQNVYVKTIYNMSVFEAEFFEKIIM